MLGLILIIMRKIDMREHFTRKIISGSLALGLSVLAISAFAATPKKWTAESLSKALAVESRPQADKDRDANRKPADLMMFYGVKPGMTVLDVFAAGGYLTEVLSITVGEKGKVYMQNPKFLAGRFPQRLADNRLPNVVAAEGDLPNPDVIKANSVDFAITAMNFHDVYNRGGAQAGQDFLKGVFETLKPGGTFAVIDHIGVDGNDNAKLHRVPKQAALDAAKAVGFVLEGESSLLANPQDDHTAAIRDSSVNGKTDQFVLKFKKPKK
jgi:predicted methyltransferase